MNTTAPTHCPAWTQLAEQADSWKGVHLRELLADPSRKAVVEAAGVRYDYSRQRLGALPLRLLVHLAEQRGFADWRSALLSAQEVNDTENRAAWHTALRASSPPAEVKETLARMRKLAEQARSRFKRVANLGPSAPDPRPRSTPRLP